MTEHSRILLTGASGWFGRSFISEYVKHNGIKSISNLTLVTSDGRDITHPLLSFTLKTITFDDARKLSGYDTIIQSSFLTRDKIDTLGPQRYSAICQAIIDSAREIIQQNPRSQVFLISSGAVYNDQSLYGIYKRIEEETFKAIIQQNLTVFRIFGATTRFMDYRNWSAICNFIKASKRKTNIHIESNKEISRGMVCMEDLSRLVLKMMTPDIDIPRPNIVCDAVSDIATIREIAELCISSENKVILPKKFNYHDFDDSYVGDPKLFLNLGSNLNVTLKKRHKQILSAINNLYPETYT